MSRCRRGEKNSGETRNHRKKFGGGGGGVHVPHGPNGVSRKDPHRDSHGDNIQLTIRGNGGAEHEEKVSHFKKDTLNREIASEQLDSFLRCLMTEGQSGKKYGQLTEMASQVIQAPVNGKRGRLQDLGMGSDTMVR